MILILVFNCILPVTVHVCPVVFNCILLDCLFQRKVYKVQLENMLVQHVFSEFKSSLGYLRARVGIVVVYSHCTDRLIIKLHMYIPFFQFTHCSLNA